MQGVRKLRPQRLRVVRIETPLLHMRNNADNLDDTPGIAHADALADRILAGKILAPKHVIDDANVWRLFIVMCGRSVSRSSGTPITRIQSGLTL